MSGCLINVFVLYDDLFIVIPDKAQIYEYYDNYDSDYNAPDKAFVASAFACDFLLKLIVRHLHVFGSVSQLLIDRNQFFTLKVSLLLDISCHIFDVLHQNVEIFNRLVIPLDQI